MGIGVGDSSNRHVGEAGENVSVARGDISGADEADTGEWSHGSAYASSAVEQTMMFESL
ncbi:hypothetical protein FHR33_003839 [Nonomuraea dietziae]|uniref:Uncharacterized protein n=1 Tax=Nonomuraea dietziae TaxID=65515 RepID=A0A7W5V2Y9_9ACTN|nr:hypothetical protein [Nonomuraea dietziae]